MSSNKYQATGTVRAIMDTQQISDTFRKREFALEIQDGSYAQTVKFQTVQDRTELLENLEVGQEITVHFNLKGREYTRKSDGATDYWTNLECWRIEAATDGPPAQDDPPFGDDDIPPPMDDDDVPF